MASDRSDIVRRARSTINTRFRPQGRLPGVGLDCVGVAAFAAGVEAPTGYDLRGTGAERIEAVLGNLGFGRVDAAHPGDVLVVAPAPGLRHLAVVTGAATVVHAHAGLRRVVEGPVDPGWSIVGVWRQREG